MKQIFFGELWFWYSEVFGCPKMSSFPWVSQIISTKYQICKLANLTFIMFFGCMGMLGHPKSSKCPNFNHSKNFCFIRKSVLRLLVPNWKQISWDEDCLNFFIIVTFVHKSHKVLNLSKISRFNLHFYKIENVVNVVNFENPLIKKQGIGP